MPHRATVIAAVCLLLWLTGWVRVWVPTIILWVATPLLLAGTGPGFMPHQVIGWSLDPVLVLFLCGFCLASAAHRQGADVTLASFTVNAAHGHTARLVALSAFATAALSMWMSNIAAAAMMFGALQPILEHEPAGSRSRRAILLAVAVGANIGGIATPIGSGPNGIAMAAVARQEPIGFVHWMSFGVPLTVALLTLVVAFVALWLRPSGGVRVAGGEASGARGRTGLLGAVFGVTIALWLSEPIHSVPAWVVAISAIVMLVATRLLHWADVWKLDWATLLLIAGGIGLGALLDRSGLIRDLASRLPLDAGSPVLRLLVLCFASAFLSSLMSNTGTAALLIPLAATLDPAPSTAILVAVSASFGMLFAISTPPNAMAVARGLAPSDLLVPGLLLMVTGCVTVALTGRFVLAAFGIP